MMPQPTAPAPTTWRSIYRVHPAADVFPMLPDADFDDMVADIKAHGLREQIVLCTDGPNWIVLDGRNRLAALERLGVPLAPTKMGIAEILPPVFRVIDPPNDPVAYIISANIHRRHIPKEERAAYIVKALEAGGATNDRAKLARSFSPTPGARGGSTKDPILEQAVAEGAKHGLSKRTMQRGLAKVRGTKPTTTSTATPGARALGGAMRELVGQLIAEKTTTKPNPGAAIEETVGTHHGAPTPKIVEPEDEPDDDDDDGTLRGLVHRLITRLAGDKKLRGADRKLLDRFLAADVIEGSPAYRCLECDQLLEDGARRCEDCNKFGERTDILGRCPHCSERIEAGTLEDA